LGKGRTQTQAIREVLALPDAAPQRGRILQLLASWRVRMDIGKLADLFQQEEIMALSEAYVVWEQETTNKGRQKGQQEGRQERGTEIALNMLQEGISVEMIARLTGLTLSEIQELSSPAH
jgi:predicted transposase/invertase (TIGR01784 family)